MPIDIHTKNVYIQCNMSMQNQRHKRVNVMFPQETLHIIDRVAQHGDRSSFIDKAVRFYIDEIGKANLKMQLKEGAQKRTHRDFEITKEWFLLEEETWRKNE